MVLDIGAGIGLAAIWFGQQGARVVALEPEQSFFEALCRNLAANAPEDVGIRVKALRAVLGPRDEELSISASTSSFQTQSVSISTLRLQAIELEDVGLVRIDLHRAHPFGSSFSAFLSFLQQTRPTLWIQGSSATTKATAAVQDGEVN